MEEHRIAPRSRTFLKATASFNNDATTVECMVRNVSETGARIEVPSMLSLPATFRISVPAQGLVRMASVRWSKGNAYGIHFSEDMRIATDDKATRMESEIRRLRKTNAELTKRLRDLGQYVSGLDA